MNHSSPVLHRSFAVLMAMAVAVPRLGRHVWTCTGTGGGVSLW